MRSMLLCLALLFFGWPSLSQASCAFINDHDQRTYCQAKKGQGAFAFINDMELRRMCQAETGR